MKRAEAAPSTRESFRKGDVIVTAVAHHYAVGRIQADGRTQEHLASEKDRARALALACQFAHAAHRVFLYQSAGDSRFAPCECPKIPSSRGKHVKTSMHQRASSVRPPAADARATADLPVTARVDTDPATKTNRTPLRMWRRLHRPDIVCQVEPMDGIGLWTVSVWRTPNPTVIVRALRPEALLISAQTKADDLAQTTFRHTCGVDTCGDWLPAEPPDARTEQSS